MTVVVISVWLKAEPTEAMLAVGAGHMHTSTILVDSCSALWALLDVQLDPKLCVVICSLRDSVFPNLKEIAADWLVPSLCASRTEEEATVTVHIDNRSQRNVDNELAISTRAPLDV